MFKSKDGHSAKKGTTSSRREKIAFRNDLFQSPLVIIGNIAHWFKKKTQLFEMSVFILPYSTKKPVFNIETSIFCLEH